MMRSIIILESAYTNHGIETSVYDALHREKSVPPSNHTCKFPLIDASMHPVTRTGDGWTCSISRHDNNKQLRIIGNPL